MALDFQAQHLCAILCNFRILGPLGEGRTVPHRRHVQCHQHLCRLRHLEIDLALQ